MRSRRMLPWTPDGEFEAKHRVFADDVEVMSGRPAGGAPSDACIHLLADPLSVSAVHAATTTRSRPRSVSGLWSVGPNRLDPDR